jgi:hypothetical protein
MKFSFRQTHLHPMVCGCEFLNRLKILPVCGLKPWLSSYIICSQKISSLLFVMFLSTLSLEVSDNTLNPKVYMLIPYISNTHFIILSLLSKRFPPPTSCMHLLFYSSELHVSCHNICPNINQWEVWGSYIHVAIKFMPFRTSRTVDQVTEHNIT